MHNSQGGAAMAYQLKATLDGFEPDVTPNPCLLTTNCIGCHSATGSATWKDPTTGAPIVFNSSAPATPLAGGNFYWVTINESYGHNIFSQDSKLSKAPGDAGFSDCGTNSCHTNLYGTVSGTGFSALDGKQGCAKCHMVNTVGPKGFHHANDGTGTKYVDSAAKGWYRFLEGHMSGAGKGVKGIEDVDWQATSSASDHNEYLGFHDPGGGYGFGFLGDTTSAFCTGCHAVFHDNQGSGSPWLRHPSDLIIPNSGEYASISTTYNPLVPVARPAGFNWAGGPSGTVAAGTDMVMCLSCHRAHGSPYYKMIRWPYKEGATLSECLSGCNVCHTSKN